VRVFPSSRLVCYEYRNIALIKERAAIAYAFTVNSGKVHRIDKINHVNRTKPRPARQFSGLEYSSNGLARLVGAYN